MSRDTKKRSSFLKFIYSYPYEGTVLASKGDWLTKEHSEKVEKIAEHAQKVWDKYEKKVLDLYREVYKIEIKEKSIEVFVSLALRNSFSHPLTISFKRLLLIEDKGERDKVFVLIVIHELAHYFMYTRPKSDLANRLYSKVKGKDLLGDRSANIHYIVNAVELTIGSEVLGREFVEKRRDWVIENKPKKDPYKVAYSRLMKDGVPLDKTCLDYIDKKVLN